MAASGEAGETDYERFKRHIRSDSVVEVVLKAHLMIESRLIDALKFLLPHPEHVNIDGMNFDSKARLCAALGIISNYELGGLRTFNKLRNNIAHELDTEITAEDVQKVVKCLEPSLAAEFKPNPRDHNDVTGYLRKIVGILFLQVSLVAARSMSAKIDEIQKKARSDAIKQVAANYGVDLGATSTDEQNSI